MCRRYVGKMQGICRTQKVWGYVLGYVGIMLEKCRKWLEKFGKCWKMLWNVGLGKCGKLWGNVGGFSSPKMYAHPRCKLSPLMIRSPAPKAHRELWNFDHLAQGAMQRLIQEVLRIIKVLPSWTTPSLWFNIWNSYLTIPTEGFVLDTRVSSIL